MASELNIAAFLQPAVDKLNQLSERERGILTAVVLVSTVVAFLEFIWSPALLELKSLDKDRQVLVRNQVTLANTVETLTQQLAEDLDAPMNLQNAQLQQQLMDQEQRLYALLGHLVKPEEMVELLRQVLQESHELKVVRVRSLPAVQIFDPHADTQGEVKEIERTETLYTHLYSHKVQIDIEAGFFSTLNYLQRLEALESGLLFNKLEYKVQTHPSAKVSLLVETIGLDKEWLGV